jgi:membrane protein
MAREKHQPGADDNHVLKPLQGIATQMNEMKNSLAVQDVEESVIKKGLRPLRAFFQKLSNDWTLNLQAGALAYHLVVAIFPILIAFFVIFGLVLGGLSSNVQKAFITALTQVLPQSLGNDLVVQVLQKIQHSAGVLSIIVLVTGIFGGSRLFILMENCFDLIYHQPPRKFIAQNIMAIGMLLIFIVLVPLMLFASTVPALVISFLKTSFLTAIPGGDILFRLLGTLGSLLVTWVLFEAMYIIVPHTRISFRDSWRGAVTAAIGLQIYLTLFPFYTTHFLKGYGGQAGFALILVIFFYYFAVILLLGAQVNAFFAEGVQKTPDNLAALVHKETSQDEKPAKEQHAQATPSHKQDMDDKDDNDQQQGTHDE